VGATRGSSKEIQSRASPPSSEFGDNARKAAERRQTFHEDSTLVTDLAPSLLYSVSLREKFRDR